MVNMEINISIKLENGDIALLIKSIFELIKKIPQDNIQVNIEPTVNPVIKQDWNTGTAPIKINDYEQGTANDSDKVHHSNTTGVSLDGDGSWNAEATQAPSKNNDDDKVYFSNNGYSVREIDTEKKKNEE